MTHEFAVLFAVLNSKRHMKFLSLAVLVGVSTVGLVAAGSAVARKTTKKTTSKASSTAKSGRRSSKASSRSRRKASGPSYQRTPDAERYKEIQQALAERGYYKGEVNGQWNQDSVAALQKFQTEKSFPNEGKINALSLFGLGLGPKHDGSLNTPAASTASPAVEPPSPPTVEPQ